MPRLPDSRFPNISEALLGLLGERDIGSVSVKEIAAAAGVSRSTFYLYFEDVYALRASIEDELVARVEEALAGMPVGPSLDDDAVARMAAVYEGCGERIYLLVRTDPDFARRVKRSLGGYLRRIVGGDASGTAGAVGSPGAARAMCTAESSTAAGSSAASGAASASGASGASGVASSSGTASAPGAPGDWADWREDLAVEAASSALIGGLEYWFENRRRIPAKQVIPQLRKAVFAVLG
ncbi:MAG: TetR/AcrR family transcriptional regulator [Eggerthellaceae bacterium]|jgi:AcrR family transcriptional regulator